MPLWSICLFVALFSLLLILGLKHIFQKLGLVDKPHEYGISRKPIPYSVGWVFLPVTLLLTTFFVQQAGHTIDLKLFSVLLAGSLIMLVSFLDDRFRISPIIRLSFQIVAALLVVWGGVHIQQLSNPFGEPFLLDHYSIEIFGQTIWLVSAALVVGWLVLSMNVMNWLDGVPGLASGVSTITFFTLMLLSLQQFHVVDQTLVIMLSSGLASATFVFWFFDFSPPKLLMGDTGSMFLGFMIGIISILAGGKMATALLVMGFPVIDAFIVIGRRILKKQSPFKGDYTHLHHRLINSGFSERKTLVFIYVVCMLCGAVALFMPSTTTKMAAFIGIALVMGFVQRKITKR